MLKQDRMGAQADGMREAAVLQLMAERLRSLADRPDSRRQRLYRTASRLDRIAADLLVDAHAH